MFSWTGGAVQRMLRAARDKVGSFAVASRRRQEERAAAEAAAEAKLRERRERGGDPLEAARKARRRRILAWAARAPRFASAIATTGSQHRAWRAAGRVGRPDEY